MKNSRLAARMLMCGAAALCLWLLSINRALIHLEDGWPKTLSIALSAGLFALLAWFAAKQRERGWLVGALLVLGLCGVGEGHRAYVRESYGATRAAPEAWVTPVTTTDLVVERFDLPLPNRRLSKVRVAHLTDLHISDSLPADYFAGLHQRIEDTKPDLLVMTGDYISVGDRLPLLRRWLLDLPALPHGTWAVLGNHDYWTGEAIAVRDALEASNVRVLQGRCVTIDELPLRLCGTEAPWGPELGAWDGPELTTIALSHTPDNVYALQELGADLVFAGHTHGGQFRLPGLGAVVIPSRFGRRFDRGHFDVGGTHLFVSAGVGADAPPLRLWCRPDLVVVDLGG